MSKPDEEQGGSADNAEAASKEARAESVSRQLSGDDAPEDTVQPSGTTEGGEGKMAPDNVGESTSRRGEDMVDADGKEPGRVDTGTDDTAAQRPTGTSTERDATGVSPTQDKDG
jgi:hypothetical protein